MQLLLKEYICVTIRKMKRKTANGVDPQTNSKVLNIITTGAVVAGVMLWMIPPTKTKVVVASATIATPKAQVTTPPVVSTQSRVEYAMSRIEAAIWRKYSREDAQARIDYVRAHLPYVIEDRSPSFALAQGGIESNWGRSYLAQRNNFFGIKCMKPLDAYGPKIHSLLAPEKRGRRVDKAEGSNDFYFFFKDLASCYAYRQINLALERYQRQINGIAEPRYFKEYAEAVAAGGWATDKKYAETIVGTIEDLEFYLLD